MRKLTPVSPDVTEQVNIADLIEDALNLNAGRTAASPGGGASPV